MVKTQYLYNATVTNVVDGDTVDVNLDLGFDVHFKTRLRLYGIDTAEVNSSDPILRGLAQLAKVRLTELVNGKSVTLETFKRDKYGRYLATVFVGDVNINHLLIAEGLAVPYMV